VPIDVLAVTYPDEPDDEDTRLGGKDDAVVADTHPAMVLLAPQLFEMESELNSRTAPAEEYGRGEVSPRTYSRATARAGLATVVCPKCGFKQEGGSAECRRCGLIFERYRLPCHTVAPDPIDRDTSRPGMLRRAYRVFRWVALGGTLIVLALILRQSSPPTLQTEPGAALRAQAKVREFQSAAKAGREATLRLDEAELNSWIQSNLAFRTQPPSVAGPAQLPAETPQTLEEVQSNVRDVRLQLQDDLIKAYVLFDFHGKEISLILEGRLYVEDGSLRLKPTAGKLGSLPLAAATLESATARLFDSAENRDKFRLPPGIQDVRVERGELSVSSK
jgi:hypothetical protein